MYDETNVSPIILGASPGGMPRCFSTTVKVTIFTLSGPALRCPAVTDLLLLSHLYARKRFYSLAEEIMEMEKKSERMSQVCSPILFVYLSAP